MFTNKALLAYEKEKDANDHGVTNRDDDKIKKDVMDRMMGVVFVKQANKVRYGKLLITIRDQYLFNTNVYPKSLHDVYELLENHS